MKLICGLSLVGLLGCPASQNSRNNPNSRPFQGQEVNLIAPRSLNLPEVWEVMIQEWASQSGASPRFTNYDCSATNQDQPFPISADSDNFLLFPLQRICEIDPELSPLPFKEGDSESKEIFKGLRERILARDRKLIASPISVPILVCYYRKDLLRTSGHQHPETWDDFHDLVASLDSWAPGQMAVEPLRADFRPTLFFARSLAYCKHPENYSVWFDADTGKPLLNDPGFEKTLEIAQRTWSKLAPESVNYGPTECRNLVLEGKAAITLAFEPSDAELISHLETNVAAKVQRPDGIEVGVCRLPGSRTVYNKNSKKWDTTPAKAVHAPPLCGFAGLLAGVIRPSKRTGESASTNLLATLSTPDEFNRAFASLPKNACRESLVTFASTWYGPDLSAEEASQYCDAVAQSLRDTQIVFELPLIGADEFRTATAEALEPLLKNLSNPKDVQNAMQQSYEAIVERLGADAVRDSYRRGLGLSPVSKKR